MSELHRTKARSRRKEDREERREGGRRGWRRAEEKSGGDGERKEAGRQGGRIDIGRSTRNSPEKGVLFLGAGVRNSQQLRSFLMDAYLYSFHATRESSLHSQEVSARRSMGMRWKMHNYAQYIRSLSEADTAISPHNLQRRTTSM